MKNTQVKIIDRVDHDKIEIILPNGAELIITTDRKLNEVHVIHNRYNDEKMVVKPTMGNTLDIMCVDINY